MFDYNVLYMDKQNRKIEEIKKALEPIFKKNGVVRASVFGSFARGEARKDSDIDILIEFPAGKTLIDLISLEQELEKILKRKVDLLTYRSIHPLLKDIIKKSEIKIYESKRW